ncbi:glutathione S-transferase C-terminal domain-containing protein [Kiloniella sp. EL199]|uniref:glutathione S-transferase C-terminal domain-containing protein n=1 Tax=Kiloniella sp. EL199 TaxID=2107581 RepID=UPI000EA18FC2|nr:glutathione S-transferase C-terminal domain-containing protein [Kiloniella sp. EL199]
MGMLYKGEWTDKDDIIHDGAYIRPDSKYNNKIPTDIIENMANSLGRYWLIGSNSCQWSQRPMLMRHLKKLDNHIPLHIAHGPRLEGYAINGGKTWNIPGSNHTIRHLHQLYTLSNSNYTGRSTVPVLWDSHTQQIISNESSQIMLALDKAQTRGQLPLTYYPPSLNEEMPDMDSWIYNGLSNGVYKAGFAQNQKAYNQAVALVFNTLDRLEQILSERRFLFGNRQTASDWKLFTTLLRFDLVYYTLHRCTKRRLADYPNLWAYTRDLYQTPSIAGTIDISTIVAASFQNDTANNPHNIIPVMPDLDWESPHNRDTLASNHY